MSLVSSSLDLTVLGEIASGGMGSVELARLSDPDGDRLVAVKRMHPEYARDPEFVRMFRDEIWLTGSLSHPNVVGLVGWGEDEAGPYLVMEYLDGVALARIASLGRRAGQPIPIELTAYVVARCAEGLHAAHSLADEEGRPLDIVHRDVTPSNILIGFDGSVKVTDFGIAKATGKSSQTRTGIIKGKIAYMSPEYALRRAVDGRADLYSLGVVMFELCSGAVPFVAKGDLELLKLVAYATTPGLGSVVSGVDADYAQVVDRLLAKSPDDRFQDGAALARTLDAWLSARGRTPAELEGALVEYAGRYAGATRQRLALMVEEAASTAQDAANSPPRSRFETRTLTLFRPRARDRERRERRGPRDDERPRTRRVAVSGYPPPPSEPVAASVRTPPELAVDVGARLSQPPALVSANGKQSSAVVGGVIAGSLLALLLVVFSVIASTREVPTASGGRPPPEPSTTAVVTEDPPIAPLESLPVEAEAPPSAGPSAAQPPKPQPATGKAKPTPARVPRPSQGTRPCTPDSFDYPACLKR